MSKKEHVSLSIDGTPFEVVGMRGEESISRLFRFELVCAARAGSYNLKALVAADATMTLHDTFGTERHVHGLIAEATERVSEDGGAELHFVLRPHAYTLLLGKQSRVFQNSTVVDIVKKIVSPLPIILLIGGKGFRFIIRIRSFIILNSMPIPSKFPSS